MNQKLEILKLKSPMKNINNEYRKTTSDLFM